MTVKEMGFSFNNLLGKAKYIPVYPGRVMQRTIPILLAGSTSYIPKLSCLIFGGPCSSKMFTPSKTIN